MDLKPGDRVLVNGNWNWPNDCTGVIAVPPASVQSLGPWRGHIRTQRGRQGIITSVWIMFDEGQTDGDGDGRIAAAKSRSST